MDSELRQQKSTGIVNQGLAANIFLSVIKTVVGIVGHSPALLADGINSVSDVAYYVAVKIFIGLAGTPPDMEHPYGHRQMESIGALVVGSFVITTSIAIFWNSFNSVYDYFSGQSGFSGASLWAFWIAVLTILLKTTLTMTSRVAAKTKNPAIQALAYDHRNDVFASLAAAIGIFLGRQGLPWVDPLAGALVALVILRTGIKILRESSLDLMDTVPGIYLSQRIEELVRKIPGVHKIDEVTAHRFGPYFIINITVCVDGSLSVAAGDRIATEVEKQLYQHMEYVMRVYVHYHPEHHLDS